MRQNCDPEAYFQSPALDPYTILSLLLRDDLSALTQLHPTNGAAGVAGQMGESINIWKSEKFISLDSEKGSPCAKFLRMGEQLESGDSSKCWEMGFINLVWSGAGRGGG